MQRKESFVRGLNEDFDAQGQSDNSGGPAELGLGEVNNVAE